MFMSFNASDIKDSILLYLLFASVSIWSCFFFFFIVVLSNLLMIPVVIENIKVKLALTIPTGKAIVLVNEKIDIPPVVALKTINILSMYSVYFV